MILLSFLVAFFSSLMLALPAEASINPLDYTGALPIMQVTDNDMFNTFFSILLFFGIVSFIIHAVLKVVNRS